jgi:Asp-tRNA(Asn)/Glu-tRNA(Gln) amidotransferase A subunit family amidase
MLGSGCSPFGIGADIGGSIRIPAEWNGLCSIKPSSRYSTLGNAYFGKYAMGLPFKSEISPIARSV